MLLDCIVVHSFNKSLNLEEELGGDWHYWKTCMREIAIGPSSLSLDPILSYTQVEVHRGADAYRFLLEVACGLYSPVIGETEVFGQFKKAFLEGELSENIRKLGQSINNDVKLVRDRHLKNLGSQSYGSLTRKAVQSSEEVHIIGAGQLAEEVIVWLNKSKRKIHIHCRIPSKYESLKKKYPDLEIHSLSDKKKSTKLSLAASVVIAAPLSAEQIQLWIDSQNLDLRGIVDLRGESAHDPLVTEVSYIRLTCLLEQLEKSSAAIRERVENAKVEIIALTNQFDRRAEFRPFGWEDVCA
jgi:glutamyl-tRNA reductase